MLRLIAALETRATRTHRNAALNGANDSVGKLLRLRKTEIIVGRKIDTG
jgi:hypothetical protein